MRQAMGLLVSAFVVLNVILFLKRPHLSAALIVLLLFCDSYLSNANRIPKSNEDRLLKPMRYENVFQKEPGLYRVALPKNAPRAMRFHYYGVNGRTPSCLGSYFRFMHEMAGVPIPRNRRHTLSARIFTQKLVLSSKVLGIKYANIRGAGRSGMLTAKNVMPRASIITQAVILPDLEAHIGFMKNPQFDPLRQVVLESDGEVTVSASTGVEKDGLPETNAVEIVRYLPNRIDLHTETTEPAYLVLSELYYPGWSAYVNGTEVPILRADYLLRAIKLGPGRGDVSFRYRPGSLFIGASITVLIILLSLAFLVFKRKKRA
jgi:hypothetical protein